MANEPSYFLGKIIPDSLLTIGFQRSKAAGVEIHSLFKSVH